MAESMKVTLVWSPKPRIVHELVLSLAQGARLSDALALAQADERFAHLPSSYGLGVWNQRSDASELLKQGDRIEIYRPLRVDPQAARRERFQKQGAKSAGLFAKRRPGAKPGY